MLKRFSSKRRGLPTKKICPRLVVQQRRGAATSTSSTSQSTEATYETQVAGVSGVDKSETYEILRHFRRVFANAIVTTDVYSIKKPMVGASVSWSCLYGLLNIVLADGIVGNGSKGTELLTSLAMKHACNVVGAPPSTSTLVNTPTGKRTAFSFAHSSSSESQEGFQHMGGSSAFSSDMNEGIGEGPAVAAFRRELLAQPSMHKCLTMAREADWEMIFSLQLHPSDPGTMLCTVHAKDPWEKSTGRRSEANGASNDTSSNGAAVVDRLLGTVTLPKSKGAIELMAKAAASVANPNLEVAIDTLHKDRIKEHMLWAKCLASTGYISAEEPNETLMASLDQLALLPDAEEDAIPLAHLNTTIPIRRGRIARVESTPSSHNNTSWTGSSTPILVSTLRVQDENENVSVFSDPTEVVRRHKPNASRSASVGKSPLPMFDRSERRAGAQGAPYTQEDSACTAMIHHDPFLRHVAHNNMDSFNSLLVGDHSPVFAGGPTTMQDGYLCQLWHHLDQRLMSMAEEERESTSSPLDPATLLRVLQKQESAAQHHQGASGLVSFESAAQYYLGWLAEVEAAKKEEGVTAVISDDAHNSQPLQNNFLPFAVFPHLLTANTGASSSEVEMSTFLDQVVSFVGLGPFMMGAGSSGSSPTVPLVGIRRGSVVTLVGGEEVSLGSDPAQQHQRSSSSPPLTPTNTLAKLLFPYTMECYWRLKEDLDKAQQLQAVWDASPHNNSKDDDADGCPSSFAKSVAPANPILTKMLDVGSIFSILRAKHWRDLKVECAPHQQSKKTAVTITSKKSRKFWERSSTAEGPIVMFMRTVGSKSELLSKFDNTFINDAKKDSVAANDSTLTTISSTSPHLKSITLYRNKLRHFIEQLFANVAIDGALSEVDIGDTISAVARYRVKLTVDVASDQPREDASKHVVFLGSSGNSMHNARVDVLERNLFPLIPPPMLEKDVLSHPSRALRRESFWDLATKHVETKYLKDKLDALCTQPSLIRFKLMKNPGGEGALTAKKKKVDDEAASPLENEDLGDEDDAHEMVYRIQVEAYPQRELCKKELFEGNSVETETPKNNGCVYRKAKEGPRVLLVLKLLLAETIEAIAAPKSEEDESSTTPGPNSVDRLLFECSANQFSFAERELCSGKSFAMVKNDGITFSLCRGKEIVKVKNSRGGVLEARICLEHENSPSLSESLPNGGDAELDYCQHVAPYLLPYSPSMRFSQHRFVDYDHRLLVYLGRGTGATAREAIDEALCDSMQLNFPDEREAIKTLRTVNLLIFNDATMLRMGWLQKPHFTFEQDNDRLRFIVTIWAPPSSNGNSEEQSNGVLSRAEHPNKVKAFKNAVDRLVDVIVDVDHSLGDLLDSETTRYNPDKRQSSKSETVKQTLRLMKSEKAAPPTANHEANIVPLWEEDAPVWGSFATKNKSIIQGYMEIIVHCKPFLDSVTYRVKPFTTPTHDGEDGIDARGSSVKDILFVVEVVGHTSNGVMDTIVYRTENPVPSLALPAALTNAFRTAAKQASSDFLEKKRKEGHDELDTHPALVKLDPLQQHNLAEITSTLGRFWEKRSTCETLPLSVSWVPARRAIRSVQGCDILQNAKIWTTSETTCSAMVWVPAENLGIDDFSTEDARAVLEQHRAANEHFVQQRLASLDDSFMGYVPITPWITAKSKKIAERRAVLWIQHQAFAAAVEQANREQITTSKTTSMTAHPTWQQVVKADGLTRESGNKTTMPPSSSSQSPSWSTGFVSMVFSCLKHVSSAEEAISSFSSVVGTLHHLNDAVRLVCGEVYADGSACQPLRLSVARGSSTPSEPAQNVPCTQFVHLHTPDKSAAEVEMRGAGFIQALLAHHYQQLHNTLTKVANFTTSDATMLVREMLETATTMSNGRVPVQWGAVNVKNFNPEAPQLYANTMENLVTRYIGNAALKLTLVEEPVSAVNNTAGWRCHMYLQVATLGNGHVAQAAGESKEKSVTLHKDDVSAHDAKIAAFAASGATSPPDTRLLVASATENSKRGARLIVFCMFIEDNLPALFEKLKDCKKGGTVQDDAATLLTQLEGASS